MWRLIQQFFQPTDVLIYNEASLQFELGKFLQSLGFTVRFERNVSKYTTVGMNSNFTKKEIDIVFFERGKDEFSNNTDKYAIELKFPRNGQHPNQMLHFIEDIKFMEEVKTHLSFKETYVLTLVDDKLFYSANGKNSTSGIYAYFRVQNNPIPTTQIFNSTGKKRKPYSLSNSYTINWVTPPNTALIESAKPQDIRYYFLNIK